MQEEMRPVINMGNGNSGNTNSVDTGFMGLSLGQIASTVVVLATLLISGGMQWSQYQNALEKIENQQVAFSQLAAKFQVLETKVAQHDKAFEAVVDTNKEMKATVGEFNKTVNKLTETVARLDGKLSR